MRRSVIAVALIATLVLVVAMIATASAHRVGRSRPTIHVVEHAATDTVVDVGASGDSTGDLLTFHNAVFDATNDHAVGHDQGECVRINPRNGTWECRWITWLPGGAITVEGPFFDTHPSTLAITGGTGRFRNARGVMRLGFRADPAEFDFIFVVGS